MIVALLILATWRLTYLIVEDIGPFQVFTRARMKLEMLNCFSCVSVWVGFSLAAIQNILIFDEAWFLSGLAYSGGALIINKILEAYF